MSQSRQLAAIMFADIAGYTSMMQHDETLAMNKLHHFKEQLKLKVQKYNGEIIQYYGDGCLMIFTNALDAVNCAKILQEDFTKDPYVPVRIGIHLGDILLEEGNIFGDSVNISSRIQSMGIPGAVLLSDAIKNQIKNKSEFQLTSLGNIEFKNVDDPIEVFALSNSGLPVPDKFNLSGKFKELITSNLVADTPVEKKKVKRRVLFFILPGIFAILTAGYFIFKNINSEVSNNSELIDKSIAVLPFVDMSAGKDQEYFSDGLSEELLNLLSKISELKVIGRTSSFSFKGKNEDLRSIAQKLGVAHILEGSVRKDGNKIRVTAQLIRATDGFHLWSETYERDLEGIFKLQDEIAGAVVKQLKLKLLTAPSGAASSASIEAHNLILQGNYFIEKRDKENLTKALDFYLKALAIDSLDASTWAKVGHCYILQISWARIDRNEGMQKARIAANKSVALDNTQAEGYYVLGLVKMWDFDWAGAETEYQKVLDLEPGNADALRSMGFLYRCIGRFDEAIQLTKKSITHDPIKPATYFNFGQLLYHNNHLEEAIVSYKKVLELNPQ
ncbi:MAG TPA: tetratricopeptide repeat protein, partial [Chitinophagaceae bacterium]|nr:tetratricopeptide repeat protein [Chitinophagaceae bacterium]